MEKMMKSINLAMIVTSVMFLVSGMAVADGGFNKNLNNQNFSKRPYHAAPQDKAYKADDQWEGTTSRTDEALDENGAVSKNTRSQNHLRLNSLGKRPYMD